MVKKETEVEIFPKPMNLDVQVVSKNLTSFDMQMMQKLHSQIK